MTEVKATKKSDFKDEGMWTQIQDAKMRTRDKTTKEQFVYAEAEFENGWI